MYNLAKNKTIKNLNMNVAIIGLGLMGGSMALSLKQLDFVHKIIGYDHNPEHQRIAMELNLIDTIGTFDDVKQADVIFLAIPVNGILHALEDLKTVAEHTTIIDLGSTKEKIVQAVPAIIRKNFVAAHPMTGTENFGPQAAIEGLYEDKVVVLCNLEDSGEHQAQTARKIFKALNMKKHFMKAKEHDRHAAFISHMPHAISYSLANTVLRQENKHNILALAAGGFRSMSRLAKSSPYMWEDIFRQNKSNILEAIELFEKELSNMKSAIKNEEWDSVHKEMSEGNKLYDIFK